MGSILPCCLPFGKAGGLQILCCQGFEVNDYNFTLDALALKPSGFCNVRVQKTILKTKVAEISATFVPYIDFSQFRPPGILAVGHFQMIRFTVRRILWLGVVLMGLCAVTFFLSRIVPGDPASLYLGPRAKPEQVEYLRSQMGLDKPLYAQFFYYMRDLAHGDLGESLRTHRPVITGIIDHLPASLELMFCAIMIATLVGIPLGAISAKKENTLTDHLSRLFSVANASLPSFWLAMIAQIVFFKWLGLFPVGGRLDTVVGLISPIEKITGFYVLDSLLTGNWTALKSSVSHLVLPSFTLATYSTGVITRMTRSTMIEVLREDYITTARSIGIAEKEIVFVQGLRNALAPTLTTAGLCFAIMLTGTFFIELIFFWPGLGTYTTTAIFSNDYPVIMGVTILMAIFYVLVNLLVDLLIAVVDPRIRLG
jgi:peptide/nickel transport system permease protein